jgi:hypothetical protein
MNPQEKKQKRNSIKVQKLKHKWAPLTKKKKETSSNPNQERARKEKEGDK